MRRKFETVKSLEALRELRVRDVMTPAPVTVRSDATLGEVVALMEARGIQHFPVVDDDKLVGLLSERCLRDALPSILTLPDPNARLRFLSATRVHQVCVHDPVTVTPEASIARAIASMRRLKAGSLPVIEHGRVTGIITGGDLLNLLDALLQP